MTTSIFQCSQHGTTSIIHNCIHKRRKNSTICILLWNGSSKYCLSTIKIVSWDHRHKNTLHLLERIQSQNNRSCRGMRLIHCISRAHANESNLTNRPNLGRIFVSSRRGTRTAMVSSKICAAGMGDRIRTFVFSHQCSSTSFWYTSLPTTSDNSIVPSSLNVILNIACIERRPAFNFVQAFWTYNSDLKTPHISFQSESLQQAQVLVCEMWDVLSYASEQDGGGYRGTVQFVQKKCSDQRPEHIQNHVQCDDRSCQMIWLTDSWTDCHCQLRSSFLIIWLGLYTKLLPMSS